MAARPWGRVWRSDEDEDETLREEQFIGTIFKEYAANALLILGEPGSGKTVTLLDLTNHLLYEAGTDETGTKPIPVVFNLSSWALKSLTLLDWLIGELREKYGVPQDLATFWLNNDALALMLDGLDEVAESQRQACVEAINEFRQSDHGLTHIAVCSRAKEYESLTQQLDLTGALMVQALSFKQADDYLAGLGEPLAAARELYQTDKQLQDWSRTPLFLSVMAIAYHGIDIEELKGVHTGSLDKLYETYVDRVLNKHRPGNPRQFESEQIKRWLTWLAARMDEYKQTIYLIEHMQPSWLTVSPIVFEQQNILVRKLRHVLGKNQIIVSDTQWSWEAAKNRLLKSVTGKRLWRNALVGGLIILLIAGLMNELIIGLLSGLSFGLSLSLITLLFSVLMYGLFNGPIRIHTSPNQGSWNNLKLGLISGLLNGLTMGLLFGLFFILIGGLSAALIDGLYAGMIGGLGLGLLYGSLFGFVGGLGDFGRHFILRKLLSHFGFLPERVRDLVPFLEEAKENLLLRQVGGGYIFIHRTLLEYFASLEKSG